MSTGAITLVVQFRDLTLIYFYKNTKGIVWVSGEIVQ